MGSASRPGQRYFGALAPASIASIVVGLRRMVITGELPPTTKLSLPRLSRQLGCQPSQLHKALFAPELRYLVVARANQGYMIPELGMAAFGELVDAQALLSTAWVLAAAEHVSDQFVTQMTAVVTQQVQAMAAHNLFCIADLDCQFHVMIAQAAGNRYVVDTALSLHNALARYAYRAYQITGGGVVGDAVAGHREIVEALKQRDTLLAKQRLIQHINEGKQRIPAIFRLAMDRTAD